MLINSASHSLFTSYKVKGSLCSAKAWTTKHKGRGHGPQHNGPCLHGLIGRPARKKIYFFNYLQAGRWAMPNTADKFMGCAKAGQCPKKVGPAPVKGLPKVKQERKIRLIHLPKQLQADKLSKQLNVIDSEHTQTGLLTEQTNRRNLW